jgi:COP9 signalosome complex subunit 3
MGLVKQTIQAMVEQNIQRLTKTYLTLSLNDIAQQVSTHQCVCLHELTFNKVNLSGAAEVEKRVLKMIQNEKVFAEINQQDGMVKFKSNPNQFDTARTLEYLDKYFFISLIFDLHW